VRWGRHAGGTRSRIAAEAGLTWPLPAELPDEESSPPSSAPASKCWLMLTTTRFGPTRTGPRLDLAQTPIISSANGRAAWGPGTIQPATQTYWGPVRVRTTPLPDPVPRRPERSRVAPRQASAFLAWARPHAPIPRDVHGAGRMLSLPILVDCTAGSSEFEFSTRTTVTDKQI
jgi:hypothetical protein